MLFTTATAILLSSLPLTLSHPSPSPPRRDLSTSDIPIPAYEPVPTVGVDTPLPAGQKSWLEFGFDSRCLGNETALVLTPSMKPNADAGGIDFPVYAEMRFYVSNSLYYSGSDLPVDTRDSFSMTFRSADDLVESYLGWLSTAPVPKVVDQMSFWAMDKNGKRVSEQYDVIPHGQGPNGGCTLPPIPADA